ncbi:MAG: type II toxin-antitoxin system prevent-host-death family antitoxin [Deltaproteobacteria bacterium]|nr:MAG: type II toxin-antitoxin system prevent-host-death family antitoxin [Deltaproteobacteria bacterium]
MDRYLNVTEARRRLLDLVENLHVADRVVITKRGRPRAVIVDSERYALLEDMAWVMQDPARRMVLQKAWTELQRGDVVRPPRGRPPTVEVLRRLARRLPRSRGRA